MFSYQTIFWSIVATLVAIQLARRGVAFVKMQIRNSSIETFSGSFDYYAQNIDDKNKQLLRTIVDAEVRQNGDALYAKWRSVVLSSGLGARGQREQYRGFLDKNEAVDRIRDVAHRTTDLDSDKNGPESFLNFRLKGYLLAGALFNFVERVETPVEFQAIFFQILDSNTFRWTPMYRSPLGASYLSVQKQNFMAKDIGPPAVMRYDFVRKRIGMLRLMEARLLNEIFLYGGVLIVTNAGPTLLERLIATVLWVSVLERKSLQAMTIPTW